MVKYSVCIAAYNVEKYIDECIKSVLNQTFSNFELIIVDDGSNDNTGHILDEYNKKDSRIKVFHNDVNKGPLFSKVRAINASTGDYLMFMDSDDYYEKNAIERMNDIVYKYDPDLILFNYRKVYPNKKIIEKEKDNKIIQFDDSNRNEFLLEVLRNSKFNSICLKCVKASLVKNNLHIPDEDYINVRRADDHYISLEIYKNVHKIIITNEILYNYRMNDSGLTQSQKKKYNFHYRCREKTVEIINNEKCLTKEEKEILHKHSVHKFINQLEEISNFNIDNNEKINIFNSIKETNYYRDYLVNILHYEKNSPKLALFKNDKYHMLINLCKVEKMVYKLFGK